MLADADIAFSGCGFMGIYYVGVSKCIDSLAPDLLQRRIGGASAGTRATLRSLIIKVLNTGALQGVTLMAKVLKWNFSKASPPPFLQWRYSTKKRARNAGKER